MGCDVEIGHRAILLPISIHAPRMGCDFKMNLTALSSIFQSTHPVWGATRSNTNINFIIRNFNPRTPYGVRRAFSAGMTSGTRFQSTHPVWGATQGFYRVYRERAISIHAPRMGCDQESLLQISYVFYFNPRTPYGVRHGFDFAVMHPLPFQSTHPVWGATRRRKQRRRQGRISIHAPRMGCDVFRYKSGLSLSNFNPRTPYGVRLIVGAV